MTTSFLKVPSSGSLFSVVIFVLCLMIFTQMSVVSAETISPPAIMEITVQDDLVTAELINAPLIDVLQKIAKELGFKAHYYGDLGELVTLSVSNMPLEKCLRQLTVNHSLSVVSRSTEQNTAKQIADIWVFSKGGNSKTTNGKPAELTVPLITSTENSNNASENSPGQSQNNQQEDVLADQLLNPPDEEEISQRQVIKDLAATGDAASVLAMAEYLSDENKELRRLAVDGISAVNNEESTQLLGQVLQNETDPEIRKIAVWALGQRKNDAVAQDFLEKALNDTDEEVKKTADQFLNQ